MKGFVTGVIVGFAVSCAVAAAASSIESHNGIFWNKLTQSAKNGYIDGYTDATRISISKLDALTTAGELFHWKGSRKIIHQVEAQLSLSQLTTDDVVNRLDALYKNQKFGELDLGSALQLMVVRPGPKNDRSSSNS